MAGSWYTEKGSDIRRQGHQVGLLILLRIHQTRILGAVLVIRDTYEVFT